MRVIQVAIVSDWVPVSGTIFLRCYVSHTSLVCEQLSTAPRVSDLVFDMCNCDLTDELSSTEKSDGMFATIIVVLPSLYSGGQVHVSHGSSRKTFDLASTSAFTTSFLTWYTDVVHEVKPITSGYRLALSYNLIHTSPGIPRPTLPNMHAAVSRIHHILHKWSKGAYDESKSRRDIVAYLLEHEYSQHNLKMGALKGKDAHLVANIRAAAEDQDFMIGLANLEYQVSGTADDPGPSYRDRRGWGYDSESEESDGGTPGMLEETEFSLTIQNLVDLDGYHIMDDLDIDEDHLIPENPFANVEPDDTEYEGYMGNVRIHIRRHYS